MNSPKCEYGTSTAEIRTRSYQLPLFVQIEWLLYFYNIIQYQTLSSTALTFHADSYIVNNVNYTTKFDNELRSDFLRSKWKSLFFIQLVRKKIIVKQVTVLVKYDFTKNLGNYLIHYAQKNVMY